MSSTKQPRRHRRRDHRGNLHTEPTPCLLALRRLHRLEMRDDEIADYLHDLSDQAIAMLETTCGQKWQFGLIDKLSVPFSGESGQWSRRMVAYHRNRMGLAAHPRKGLLAERRALDRRFALQSFARQHGWLHFQQRNLVLTRLLLLREFAPAAVARRLRWPLVAIEAWVAKPWDILHRHEIEILSCLSGRGGMTRRQIEETFQHGRRHRTRKALAALLGKRLIERDGYRYRLTPGVAREQEHFTPNGIDRLCKSLGLGFN